MFRELFVLKMQQRFLTNVRSRNVQMAFHTDSHATDQMPIYLRRIIRYMTGLEHRLCREKEVPK